MDSIRVKEEINDNIDDNNKTTEVLNENQIKTELIDDNMSDNTIHSNTNTLNLNTSQMNLNCRLRRGRKNRRIGGKVDIRAKLERSRQSARECRARKKLRYQYLEDLVVKREMANIALKHELQMFREIAKKIDSGHKPQEMLVKVEDDKQRKNRRA